MLQFGAISRPPSVKQKIDTKAGKCAGIDLSYLHNTGNSLSCIIMRMYDIRECMPWFCLAHHHLRRHYLLPLLQPRCRSPSPPKGSLARSNASEGYPFEKVKSPRRGCRVLRGLDSLIVPMLASLLFSSSSLRFRFDHGPEKNNLGKGERLGGEREREKDLKNIESHRILLLPLKHYEL